MRESTSPPNTSAVPPLGHVDALPSGAMLGEFEVQSLLGVGGFGMVYRGYDHTLHRPVAIKEYMPSALVGRDASLALTARSTADNQPFQSGLQSFIDEARLLARFEHPSLVKVYRFWEANNTAYMAMPLYEGVTLKEARRRMSGPPPEAWLRQVLWSVLEALRVLHDNAMLHRDVSPDNIFLQDVGPPVLLDLGAARRAILDSSHKHTAILKVNYAPIEQYADAPDLREGPWTDLYALAAVVHGCVCNESPLPATFRVVRDRMPPFAQVAQTAQTHFGQAYAPEFVRAVAHALAIEPDHRPQSVDAFAEEMQLLSPSDMARFDWREALGTGVTLETDVPPVVTHTTALLTTQPAPQPRTQSLGAKRSRGEGRDSKATRASPRKRASAERKNRPSASARWVGWGVFVVVVVLLLVSAYMALRKPSATLEQAPPALATRAPVLVEDAALVAASAPVVSPALAAPAVPKPVIPKVPPSALEKPVPAVPIRPSRAEAKPAAGPVSTPVAPVAPVELCVNASVWTRSMCVYQECQKAEYAQLPVCIADRKRWESQNNKAQSP
ncbi:serine/threonine-protein kinase [Rhodoferax sp. TS-BS-61-7]|uniref:serine/threonine protein kinase n=1 Tax=Rhodoferax sp. TS-BS-61-7 TaxID=2094194 RepID=UPI000CF60CA8|nr:serine/threonine-protein kinase [Rhodoferax sp. TS-BS-61-7]PQA77664.1 serine/threonine protein kinase [Rhodoferax sp. TS-BS-61-7]